MKESVKQEVTSAAKHDAEMIRALTGLDAENMLAITALTDTMAPTIMPGDVCLVEGSNAVGRAGIYAVKNNDVAGFCRLLPQGQSGVMITLDNQLYPLNLTVPASEFADTIIGRVISITKNV